MVTTNLRWRPSQSSAMSCECVEVFVFAFVIMTDVLILLCEAMVEVAILKKSGAQVKHGVELCVVVLVI